LLSCSYSPLVPYPIKIEDTSINYITNNGDFHESGGKSQKGPAKSWFVYGYLDKFDQIGIIFIGSK